MDVRTVDDRIEKDEDVEDAEAAESVLPPRTQTTQSI
jgi:hypothetical protein